ncbi:MAG: hypothetical protein A4E32_01610 [Methanomassiliicoccales archaeon PtaU1.Bin124]|nr:MAG: hypothetical protein A4E32_01610 [Methanomassiliicoccales archaeon PtaU1.Bin124]
MEKTNCEYRDICVRGGDDYPMVLFPMLGRKIKMDAVIISQEPAAQRRSIDSPDHKDAIEIHLRNEGLGRKSPHTLLRQIQDIIGRPFDAFDDSFYWTHSLKCIPMDDNDINERGRNEWAKCSLYCINNLTQELKSLDSNSILIIALGRYATGAALAVINNQPEFLKKPPKIHNFIASLGNGGEDRKISSSQSMKHFGPYLWNDKKFYLTSFRHGANNNRCSGVPKNVLDAVKMNEIEERTFVREWLSGTFSQGI